MHPLLDCAPSACLKSSNVIMLPMTRCSTMDRHKTSALQNLPLPSNLFCPHKLKKTPTAFLSCFLDVILGFYFLFMFSVLVRVSTHFICRRCLFCLFLPSTFCSLAAIFNSKASPNSFSPFHFSSTILGSFLASFSPEIRPSVLFPRAKFDRGRTPLRVEVRFKWPRVMAQNDGIANFCHTRQQKKQCHIKTKLVFQTILELKKYFENTFH